MDEPFLNLGKSFQSQQKEVDNTKEAWEMQEFLTSGLQEMGEEREMLVDEEYELYQDCFQSMDLYPSSHIQEAASVPSMKELHFGTQWLRDNEPLEAQETRSITSIYSQEAQQYGYGTESMVRDVSEQIFHIFPVSSPSSPSPCYVTERNKI